MLPPLKMTRPTSTDFSSLINRFACVQQPAGTTVMYEGVKIQVKLLNMSVIRQRSTCCSLWWKTFLFGRTYDGLRHTPVGTGFRLCGAPPHFSCGVRALLDSGFPDCWRGRGPIPWPGFLQILQRERNVRAAKYVTNKTFVNTWRHTEYRVEVCRAINGLLSYIYLAHKKFDEVQRLR
jgi:hypothetical protein